MSGFSDPLSHWLHSCQSFELYHLSIHSDGERKQTINESKGGRETDKKRKEVCLFLRFTAERI